MRLDIMQAVPEPQSVAGEGETQRRIRQAREKSPLLARPGFLIRRLHQIHCSLFLEETGAFNITPVQYSLMTALARAGEMDQIGLAREIGLERTSVAEVLTRLHARGYLERRASALDGRVKLVRITRKGKALVQKMRPAVQRAHDRTIECLPPDERDQLMLLLIRMVESNNDVAAAPMRL